MKTIKLIAFLFLVATVCTLLAGCASSGGKQEALRNATFAIGKDGASVGTVTVTRTIDPKTGKVTAETVSASNVATFTERDRSKVHARGLFAVQTVNEFSHERSGFLGSSSKSGVLKYEADPDEAAIKSSGEAASKVVEAVGSAAKKAVTPAPTPTR